MIKKKHLFFSISVLFFSILFVDLLASSLYSLYKDKNTENDILRAGEVENIISRKLREALLVCRYMASDSLLIDVIHKEPSRSLDETLVVLRPYLSKIKDKYSYSTVDFLSDQTHRYYNEFGVLKTIDPDNWDFWYKRFTNEEIYFDIETFRDPDDYSKSQIFFNVRVDDNRGKFLGIASVALYIADFQKVISYYEKKYNVKINFVTPEGTVFLDSDLDNVEQSSLAWLINSNGKDSRESRYVRIGPSSFAVTNYIEDLNAYFIMQASNKSRFVSTQSLFFGLSFFIFLLGLLLLVKSDRVFSKQRLSIAYQDKTSEKDLLTGLPNRNFLKQTYGERGVLIQPGISALRFLTLIFLRKKMIAVMGMIS